MTMSFLEKLKMLHSGPPAPPRRVDTSGNGWSEDEFDEEEGDTYEAPPCEPPTTKGPHRKIEENVYLERTTQPAYSQRPFNKAPPPPRPDKNTSKMRPPEPLPEEKIYIDPNYRKQVPEVNRRDKKPNKSPPAIPAPHQEEDVYLDPNEGQSAGELPHDVYVEPTPVRPPGPGGHMPSIHTGRDLPHLIIKPPVPQPKSSSLVISRSQIAERSYNKLPPPTPNNRPPFPPGLKGPKPCPPPPPSTDFSVPMTSPGGQEVGLKDREWFAGICSRRTAEDALLKIKKDGSFMVRCSTAQDARQPYTLVVLFNQKVYNIPVRFIQNSNSYALGKEGKKTEELFGSLQEMISHHKDNPLLLIDSKSQAKHTTYLTYPIHP